MASSRMGLTKQYLRYAPAGIFNLIASTGSNVVFVVLEGQEGRFLAAGACENVIIWDLRLGEKAMVLAGDDYQVAHLCPSPDRIHLAVGYSNGTINIFNLISGEVDMTFSGHRTSISTLCFDKLGHRLASGGKDTEIVIWDIVAETGVARLSGHKGVVTSVAFLKNKNILVSGSKDSFIKLWDVETSHCFHTIAAHVTEVWSVSIAGEDEFLVAGSSDSELRVWSLKDPGEDSEDLQELVKCVKSGSIMRSGRGRVVSTDVDKSGAILAVHGTDPTVELFMFQSLEEATKRWKKRKLKEKKKAEKTSGEYNESELSLKDYVVRLAPIKASGKIKSVSVIKGKDEVRVAVSLTNNKVELYSVSLTDPKAEPKNLRRIFQHGHQGEVRAVAFSSDNLAIASTGASSVKIWNRVSLACLRTVECKYAISICFVPGDRHALVGMKEGQLLIVDLSAGEILEEIPAHTTELWSVVLSADKTCAVTCGGDSTIKIWRFELVRAEDKNAKVLSLSHIRTLKLEEPLLNVKVSPCGKYLAAALLDSTVKIFFYDTFKFFLSLYGHKLPVLCTDISYDSALIVTGSADRNIKIWGMDFGDCHKSIFAHDDSVTAVAFVSKTHYFFSIGKDGKVKQWDADNFNKIITLHGHFGEGWNLAVGGEFLVTCGHDRSLRLYQKTEEIVVLSDEQEEERGREELATGDESSRVLPSTKTLTAEKGAESLMECVEEIKNYEEELKLGGKPSLPPMMAALKLKTLDDYLSKTLSSIASSELGEALILLSLDQVLIILEHMPNLLSSPLTCEMASRALILLLKVHLGPLSADHGKLPLFNKIQDAAKKAITSFKDQLGYNMYALGFIQREIEEKEGIQAFEDAVSKHKEKQKRKKRKEKAQQAAILSL